MGKRGDKRRKKERERAQRRRVPYEGFQYGPLRVERFGRRLYTSLDPTSPDFKVYQEAVGDMVANLPNEYADGVRRLTQLLADFDAFDALAAIWMTNAVADPETYKEWEHPGVIAAPELAAALLLRRPTREGQRPEAMLSGAVILEAQDLLVQLLQMKGFMLMENATKRTDSSDSFAELRATGLVHRLAVRGPSYHWQEEQTVRELFEDERVRNDVLAACGFTASAALKLVDGVVEVGLRRLSERANDAKATAELLIADLQRDREHQSLQDARSAPMVAALEGLDLADAEAAIHSRLIAWTSVALGTTMSFTPGDLAAHAGCTIDETEAFLSMFSLPFGEPPVPGREIDIEDVRNHPLTRDDAGHYLCVSLPSLLFALRGRIESALKDHGQKTFSRYERHRSRVVERRAVAALAKALRPDWTHEGLSYDIEEEGIAKKPELDGLVRVDSALLIVESKASSMRPSAKRLAPDSLRDWLKSEVSHAAKQARRARTALLDSASPPTMTDQAGKRVSVNLAGIHHAFELIVVLEDLSAVAPSTWLLADAEILPREPIPLLITLHELEIICDIVERPSELIHYMLRRRRMDETRSAWGFDELDYFMHYLLFGLYWSDREDVEPVPPERLLSHTEELDSWFFYQHGERKKSAERPGPKHHPDVANLLDCIEHSGASGRLDTALAILDFDAKPRRKIADLLRNLKRRSQLDGQHHDASLVNSEFGVTIMTCPPAASPGLATQLRQYCGLKKYQMEADRWVGIGGWSGPKDVVQVAVVFNEPWQANPELDRLVATLPSAGHDGNFDGRVEGRRKSAKAKSQGPK
jgi:hypothetical protein